MALAARAAGVRVAAARALVISASARNHRLSNPPNETPCARTCCTCASASRASARRPAESLHLRFAPGGSLTSSSSQPGASFARASATRPFAPPHPPTALQRMAERGEVAGDMLDDYRFLQGPACPATNTRSARRPVACRDRSPLARSLDLSEDQLSYELSKRMARVRASFAKVG